MTLSQRLSTVSVNTASSFFDCDEVGPDLEGFVIELVVVVADGLGGELVEEVLHARLTTR